MVNKFQNWLFAFVKYRIHLSAVFFLLLLHNNNRQSEQINILLIASFTFWHFALFLFDRVYDREIDAISQPDEYVKNKNANLLYIIVSLFLIGSFITYSFTEYPLKYWFILLPITFLYPFKIFKEWRFKKVFLVKNLYSAFLIYSLPLMIQSHLISSGSYNLKELFLPHLPLFIYVMIGEVFWDIRDKSVDKAYNTKTIPNILGIPFTKLYIFVLILIDAYITDNYFTYSAYIYFILIIFVRENTNRLVFHLPPLTALLRSIL